MYEIIKLCKGGATAAVDNFGKRYLVTCEAWTVEAWTVHVCEATLQLRGEPECVLG